MRQLAIGEVRGTFQTGRNHATGKPEMQSIEIQADGTRIIRVLHPKTRVIPRQDDGSCWHMLDVIEVAFGGKFSVRFVNVLGEAVTARCLRRRRSAKAVTA